MRIESASWSRGLGASLLLVMLSACAVGVGYDGPVGYVGGVYEPYGYEYGGWGGGYHVGPPRGGAREGGGGRGAPSIPRAPRGGGHGGGHER
ncbi:MAG: hypothetical protein ACLQO1_24320 [Steroidobacteraceae bacterium]